MLTYYNRLFYSILVALIPPSLITGPLIPEILLIIITILFLFDILKNKFFFYFKNIFFLGFYLILHLSY